MMRAIDMAIEYKYEPVKINCVVMRGFNDNELADFAAWTRHKPVEIRFIEYMPFDGNGWNDGRFMPYTEMIERIEESHPHTSTAQ